MSVESLNTKNTKKRHWSLDVLQERSIKRLKETYDFLVKHQTLPLSNKGFTIPSPSADHHTAVWLRSNIARAIDKPTTPLRAALVKLGALPPRGDEAQYADLMPSFLNNVGDHEAPVDNMARSPRGKRRELSPNPFKEILTSGGHRGSPFID